MGTGYFNEEDHKKLIKQLEKNRLRNRSKRKNKTISIRGSDEM